MEVVNWSLNAIDRISSMRSLGLEEPICPDGTFAAGYTMDSWEKWRVVCLATLSVEDIEDLYIFGTMITGFLLIGLGTALLYQKIWSVSAVQSPLKLPELIDGVCRAVSAQTVAGNRTMEISMERAMSALTVAINHNTDNNSESLTVIINRNMDTTLDRAVHALNAVSNRNMENIMEKLSALQRRMDGPGDQNGQTE